MTEELINASWVNILRDVFITDPAPLFALQIKLFREYFKTRIKILFRASYKTRNHFLRVIGSRDLSRCVYKKGVQTPTPIFSNVRSNSKYL